MNVIHDDDFWCGIVVCCVVVVSLSSSNGVFGIISIAFFCPLNFLHRLLPLHFLHYKRLAFEPNVYVFVMLMNYECKFESKMYVCVLDFWITKFQASLWRLKFKEF